MRKPRVNSTKHSPHVEQNEPRAPRNDQVVCPCHAPWEMFEKNVRVVLSQMKTGDRAARAHALHVFDDAMRMQLLEDLESALEPGERKLDERRACGFRSMEERIKARRERLLQKRKRHTH